MFMVAQFYQSCLYLTLFLSHFLSVFFFQLVQILNKNVFSCHQLINAQYFCDCPSNPSSVLGMSKISANNGGSRMKVQFVRSQSRWETCIAPSALSSVIFASRAGIIWRALVEPGLVRTICTLSASATRSRHRDNLLWLMEPNRLLLLVMRTNAQNSPTSVSLRLNEFMLLAKFTKAEENPFC